MYSFVNIFCVSVTLVKTQVLRVLLFTLISFIFSLLPLSFVLAVSPVCLWEHLYSSKFKVKALNLFWS